MLSVLVSAIAAVLVAAVTVYATKAKERDAVWRAKKLSYYEEFFAAASGIVGGSPSGPAKIRFANAVNNLHLIAPQNVLDALHSFCDEIAESNSARSKFEHDKLWSALVWHIRADLVPAQGKALATFEARLWASGVGRNTLDS